MTGDPNRVVKFGTNFETQKIIEFAWSSFVMPSCEACNTQYSQLENEAKTVVEALVERRPLKATAYLTLLDWLDKVRVGLWLAYHVLQANPTGITPAFYINTRLGTKDRFVAFYPIETDTPGLNAFGVESFLFHSAPSCFALRINNVLLLNGSADFLFAARCGFPFPRIRRLLTDGPNAGLLQLEEFDCRRRTKHPILRQKLHKPSVFLFQPIMQRSADSSTQFLGDSSTFDSFLAEHTLPPYLSGKGILFRQYSDRVEPISDIDQEIALDSVVGRECQPMYALMAQVYELQNTIRDLYGPLAADRQQLSAYEEETKLFKKWNTRVSNYLRNEAARTHIRASQRTPASTRR